LFCSFNAADCHLHVDTLAGNAFSVLPQALQACSMLANLQMRGNQLEELPAWISGMANLRTLNVIANQLQALPFELADLRRLQDLKYEDNDLNFPPPTVLEGGLDAIKVYLGRLRSAPATGVVDLVRAPMTAFSCPNYLASYPITQLILNFNGLRELRVDLARLSSLKVLDLKDNALARIPAVVGELAQLERLRADRNRIEFLDPAIGQCTALVSVSLEANLLSMLPPSLGLCSRLRKLAVAGNPLVSPPEMVVRKRSLEWLLGYMRASHHCRQTGAMQLISMEMSEIPADVFAFTATTKLLLNCNDLRDVPSEMPLLTNLLSLSLANNKLMRLPVPVCHVSVLQSLVLDDNMIKELPAALNLLSSLLNLSVAHNDLSIFPTKLHGLMHLRKLCLDGNQLGIVPNSVLALSTLEELSMRACGVAALPDAITLLVNLRDLRLTDNAIESLPQLAGMSEMRILRLSNNKLLDLPPPVLELFELRELSIAGNMIQKLPPELSCLTALELLHLDGHNFDSVPAELVSQGGSRVLDFMRRMGFADSSARLDLCGMGLKAVPASVMRIAALEHLLLSNNPVTHLPASIMQLELLKTLALDGTRIISLPVTLPDLVDLKDLRLEVGEMVFPPAEVCEGGTQTIIAYLRKIKQASLMGALDMSGTNMQEVPAEITAAAGIKSLNLANNRISRLPAELALLSSVTALNLDGNPLRPHVADVVQRGLPALWSYLAALLRASQTGKLDMQGQGMRFYPDDVPPAWGVSWMNLDRNQLRHLPRKMGHLVRLSLVSMRDNLLVDLPETLSALTRLEELYLDNNALEALPTCVPALGTLRVLSLSHNRLRTLPPQMEFLHALEHLAVDHNSDLTALPLGLGILSRLARIDFDSATVTEPCTQFHGDIATLLWGMKTMHLSRQSNTLDLSARNLTTLPREVLKLTGLTALSVARNQIASLPDEMMEFLCNLRFLDLEQNKWVSSPLPLPSKIPRILIPAGASLRGLPRCDCFLGADATLCCDPG